MGEHAGSSPSRHIPSGSPRPSHEWQRGAPRQAPDYQSRHTPGVCALPGIVVLPPSVRPSAGHRKATLLPAGGAVLGKGCRFHDRRAAINPFRAPRLLAALLESLSAGKRFPTGTPPRPAPNSHSPARVHSPGEPQLQLYYSFYPNCPAYRFGKNREQSLVWLPSMPSVTWHPKPWAAGVTGDEQCPSQESPKGPLHQTLPVR